MSHKEKTETLNHWRFIQPLIRKKSPMVYHLGKESLSFDMSYTKHELQFACKFTL